MKTIWILLSIFGLLAFSCAHKNNKRANFPDHWWKAVDQKELKWWEVSPEAAGKGEVILSKRNELGILSNFADTPIVYEGKKFKSLEGIWQSMKYPENDRDERFNKKVSWPYRRSTVEQMAGHKAKKAGGAGSKNMKKLNINWVSWKGKKMTYRTSEKGEHYNFIRNLMIEKYKQNPKVREVLLSTGDLILKPDHKVEPDSPPAWRYYDIWMEIRELARKGKL